MIEIILLLISIGIIIPILLLLPSVFSKMLTILLVVITAIYFYTGMLLLDYFHWSTVVGVVAILILITSSIVAYNLDKKGNNTTE